jgi:hypothetical protein
LSAGNYQISTVAAGQNVIVLSNAVLYVTGDVLLSGSGHIRIQQYASLQLYVGGANASFGGGGIMNNNWRTDSFQYYGLSGNTSVTFSANSIPVGIIHAPNAECVFGGGQLIGAFVLRRLQLSGSLALHFDESLKLSGPPNDGLAG